MHEFPKRTDKLRILISNDDGVRAPGIKVLERIARELSDDVWVVAPLTEQSGAGHSLTLRYPIWLRRLATRRYAVEGTPTDSVLVGIHKALKDRKPDLVLSGVNRGSNVAEFITYSGTCAVAMEATILGVPAIALSQQTDFDRNYTHWSTAEHHAPGIIRKLMRAGWPDRNFININFPDCLPNEVASIEVTEQGSRPMGDSLVESRHPRGGRYYWVGSLPTQVKGKKGTDLAALEEKRISVTPVDLNFTNKRAMKPLAAALKGRKKQ
ncbi:MAG: 5'/3'-nucleotidase SurE [Alphaproteobacteria bacterium]|nr:5'/3'-nucleotidase SurE [Alphaproteobacteria bacterium]HCO99926.1 5'/3'-nucleotidase SurE [Rhodospirillaceae bacterium]|tara:strand:+ start:488 stop:1288 length:801 start_codon:yes stop_codon:yes gene_type:complete